MDLTFNNKSACLVIFFLSLFLYGNTLFHGFVWDDHYLIPNNPQMKDISSISSFFAKDFWENSSIHFKSGFYRPLTLSTFFLNYHLWQGHAFGFYLFNIILPVLNLVPISNTIAKRFLYLPMIGYSFLAANCLYLVWEKVNRTQGIFGRLIFYGILVFFLILFSFKTITRNMAWRSDFSLFSSATAVWPCAPVAHINLSAYYNLRKDSQKGKRRI